MSDAAQWGESLALDFKGHTIRAVPIDGVPWFALPDIAAALGYGTTGEEVVHDRRFPAFALTKGQELPDPEIPGEPGLVTLLSPVGVWLWTHFTDPGRGQALAAWARKEALQRCPAHSPKDPSVRLTILPNDTMPPYPLKYSGRKTEWCDLRDLYPCSRLWDCDVLEPIRAHAA